MFKFNVNITDNDYLDYNVFWMTRSHYGKKQITKLRIFIAVLIALYISAMLFSGSFASGTFLSSMPLVIFLAFLFAISIYSFFIICKGELLPFAKTYSGEICY